MELKEAYNLTAANWHKKHNSDTWWQEGTEKFISWLPKGAKVLDVGCGTGVKSRYMVDKGLNVTGVDFAEEMIKIATHDVLEATFKVLDLNAIDKFPEKFDGILAQAVLLHFRRDEIPGLLEKLKTRLNPGGHLYVAVKQKRPDGPDEKIVHDNQYGIETERFFCFFTMEEMKKFLGDAGLRIEYEQLVENGTWKNNWIILIGKNI